MDMVQRKADHSTVRLLQLSVRDLDLRVPGGPVNPLLRASSRSPPRMDSSALPELEVTRRALLPPPPPPPPAAPLGYDAARVRPLSPPRPYGYGYQPHLGRPVSPPSRYQNAGGGDAALRGHGGGGLLCGPPPPPRKRSNSPPAAYLAPGADARENRIMTMMDRDWAGSSTTTTAATTSSTHGTHPLGNYKDYSYPSSVPVAARSGDLGHGQDSRLGEGPVVAAPKGAAAEWAALPAEGSLGSVATGAAAPRDGERAVADACPLPPAPPAPAAPLVAPRPTQPPASGGSREVSMSSSGGFPIVTPATAGPAPPPVLPSGGAEAGASPPATAQLDTAPASALAPAESAHGRSPLFQRLGLEPPQR